MNILYDRNNNFKLSIFNYRIFWIILFAKIVSGGLFASEYLTNLFYPFIDYFVNSNSLSTYNEFYETGRGNSFPYPVFMLYVVSFFKLFFSNNDVLSFVDLELIRIPILFADLIILIVLSRWLKGNQKTLLIFYWLNPILFYINYIHGQLDVIPTAFLIVGLYFLFKKNWVLNSIFIAFSILAKTNFIIVLPFLILYMLKAEDFTAKKILGSFSVLFILILSVQLSLVFESSYLNMVYNNKAQQKFLNLFISYDSNLLFFITPSIILFLFFYGSSFKNFNKNLFILFLSFSFATITVLTPPSQGWYYWFIPFFIYFIIKDSSQTSKTYYWIFVASYFLYFLVIPESDFLKVCFFFPDTKTTFHSIMPISDNLKSLIVNISFTLLQSTLLINCIIILVKGIESYKQNKFLYKPLLIGVGGDSGSGKTTFSNMVKNLYGPSQTTIIKGDDMHKWERGDNNWRKKTHLDPSSNHIHKEIEFIKFLKKGITIKRRSYDHKSGKFTIPSKIKSKRVVIYEGLHPFYLSDMKNSFDISFFIQPDENLRKKWKIERDTNKRGYSKEKIIKQLKDREKDSLKYIQSQAAAADVVVNLRQSNANKEKLVLNLKINSNLDLEMLLSELNNFVNFKYNYYIDHHHHHLTFYKGLSSKKVEEIAYNINPEIDELLSDKPKWESDLNGLLQLIQIICVQSKLANE